MIRKGLYERKYLTRPLYIAKFLSRIIRNYGFYVRYNQSVTSESTYLKINVGSAGEPPNTVHVRVSNHQVSRNNTSTVYDYDICGTHSRDGAITYVKFLKKFADDHDKILPYWFKHYKPGTMKYKNYAIELQKRA